MRVLVPSILVAFPALATAQATLLVPEQYTTIQSAIVASVPGDTVLVGPGTYVENLDYLGKDVAVRSRYGARSTVVDGGGQGSVVRLESGEGPGAVLSGFTLRNGFAMLGGGVLCDGSSPTISACVVRDCTAFDGGGIWVRDGSPAIVDCVLTENTAGCWGSGIYVGPAQAANNPALVTGCTVYENTSLDYWHLSVGLAIDDQADARITNTISRDNHILFGNQEDLYCAGPGCVTFSNWRGAPPTDGNIDLDPLFAAFASGDLHLTDGSPCRDAGTAAAPGLSTRDFEGDPRSVGAAPDIGADEHSLRLYHRGDATPGATIDLVVVGAVVGTTCTAWLSPGVVDPPLATPFGRWYLLDRRIVPFQGLAVPANGILEVPYTLPPTLPAPLPLFGQALAGSALTPLETVAVE